MRLLDELNAAVRAVFLHSLNKHGCLFSLFVEFVFGGSILLLELDILFTVFLFLNLSARLLGFNLSGRDCLQDGDVEGRLALLVKHEEVMR